MGTGNFQSRMGSLTRFLTRGTPALETPCERTDLILELVPTRSHVQIPKTASILLSFWHKVSRLTAWHLAFNSKQAHASSRNGVLHHRKDNCWMENTWSGGFYTPLHWVVLFLPCSRLKFRLRTFSRNGSELRVAGLSAGRPCPPPRPFSWREWPGTKRWLEASLSLILRQNTDFRTVMGGNWPGESRRCFRWPMKATNDPGNVFSNLFQMLELVVVF